MAVLLRTAVAFLFLACIGANGQAIPEYPRPEFQSEMVPPVDQAAEDYKPETVPQVDQAKQEYQPEMGPPVDQTAQKLQAETVPPVDRAAPQPAVYTQRASQPERVHYSAPRVTYKGQEPMPRRSPSLFGLKTFLIGLIVFAGLLHLSVIKAGGHNGINGWQDFLKSDEEGTAGIVENAERMARHLLSPFNSQTDLLTIPYFASFAIMLSGFYHFVASIGRKMRARMGKSVSLSPPMRGSFFVFAGIFMLALCVLGIFVFNMMASLGLSLVAAGITVGALLLVAGSLIQRHRYIRRLQ